MKVDNVSLQYNAWCVAGMQGVASVVYVVSNFISWSQACLTQTSFRNFRKINSLISISNIICLTLLQPK